MQFNYIKEKIFEWNLQFLSNSFSNLSNCAPGNTKNYYSYIFGQWINKIIISDLWFWSGTRGRARREQTHDPRGSDAVLQGTRDPDGG